MEGQPQPEQLSSLPVGAAHQPTGVETHPDQEAAGSSVSAQHHQEPPAAGPAGGQGQLVGVEARPDQGRAGAGGDGQSDRPTPPVNRGATPRAQVSDPAHTLVTGRGGGGGGGVFGGAGRGGYQAPFPGQRNFVPGHQAPFPAGHSLPGHQAPFTGQWQWNGATYQDIRHCFRRVTCYQDIRHRFRRVTCYQDIRHRFQINGASKAVSYHAVGVNTSWPTTLDRSNECAPGGACHFH